MYPFEVSNFVGHKDINGDANNEKNWRKGIILPLYQGKGSQREYKNYRCITLFSILLSHIK